MTKTKLGKTAVIILIGKKLFLDQQLVKIKAVLGNFTNKELQRKQEWVTEYSRT